jgi:hypothetical protein
MSPFPFHMLVHKSQVLGNCKNTSDDSAWNASHLVWTIQDQDYATSFFSLSLILLIAFSSFLYFFCNVDSLLALTLMKRLFMCLCLVPEI